MYAKLAETEKEKKIRKHTYTYIDKVNGKYFQKPGLSSNLALILI